MWRSVVMVSVMGCSLVTVRGAPDPDPGYRPTGCTESVFAPVVDSVPATLGLLITGSALADISNDSPGNEGRALVGSLVAIVFGLPAVIFGGSAIYGFKRTATCRALNATPPLMVPVPMPMPVPVPVPIPPPIQPWAPPPSPAPINPGAGSQVEPT